MKISLSSQQPTAVAADIVAIGVRTAKVDRDENLSRLDRALGGSLLGELMKDEGFEGKPGQLVKLAARGRVKARWILLVGLPAGESPSQQARRVAVSVARSARGLKTAAIFLPDDSPDSARAAAEGVMTGAYQYARYKTGSRKPKGGLRSVTLLASGSEGELVPAIRSGRVVAESINVARDLVNGPPNDVTPVTMAEAVAELAEKYGVKCEAWNKKRLEKEGMNLFLAVNSGSAVEPRLVHLSHVPEKPVRKVVYVGKGITFDAGGLCLKPPKSMVDMKCDMAGAAVTVGIVLAAARLGLPVEVHGLIGATENMTGAGAYRPGDVISSHDGKTVEIINTDAEGRLVLADVLAYARGLKPDYMIDHATLTGACMVALGPWTAGFFTGDEELAASYQAAASHEGETIWRMPLDARLRKTLDSDVADLKHTGASYGGAVTAALFLQDFVGKTRWAHLDIAGPAFLEQSHENSPKGATGFGVATGVRFLETLAREAAQ